MAWNFSRDVKKADDEFFKETDELQICPGEFHLQHILENSLFYPFCSFDAGVIKDCNTQSCYTSGTFLDK